MIGSGDRDRTCDLRINNPLLCLLSYSRMKLLAIEAVKSDALTRTERIFFAFASLKLDPAVQANIRDHCDAGVMMTLMIELSHQLEVFWNIISLFFVAMVDDGAGKIIRVKPGLAPPIYSMLVGVASTVAFSRVIGRWNYQFVGTVPH